MSTPALLLLALASPGATPDSVLFDFTATWCGPCQQMRPIVTKLEREGLPVRQIDVDQNRDLAMRYGVGSIPAFVLVVDGKVADRVVGVTSEDHLRQMLAKIPATRPAAPKAEVASSKGAKGKPLAPLQRAVRVKDAVLVDRGGSSSVGESRPFFQLPSLPPLFRPKRNVAIDAPTDAFAEEPVVRGNTPEEMMSDPTGVENSNSEASPALASSTRIRVKDDDGINFGSGTVIDSRPGRTVILTCGHIFRELTKSSTIEVDIFEAGESKSFIGTLIDFDAEADVGLVAIPTSNEIPKALVAAKDESARKADRVVSIGCGGGENPTEQKLEVTSLNRYLGPDNIECTGVPIQGRSGGGLFNAEGHIIGVCIAADPKEHRGLYAGLQCVHDLLKKTGFGHLVGEPEAEPAAIASSNNEIELQPAAAVNTMPSTETAAAKDEFPDTTDLEAELAAMSAERARDSERVVNEAAGAETGTPTSEIGEAEIVCIIRPIGKTNAASRVVVINRATPKFLSYLTGEMRSQPQPTMKTVPNDRAGQKKQTPKVQDQGKDRSSLRKANGRIEPCVVNRPDTDHASRFTRDPLVELSLADKSAQIVAVSVQETSVIPRRYRRSAESR